jgi:hypothetical protein
VPKHARQGAFIVNCAMSPLVSLHDWQYEVGGGLGGSAAHALLCGRNSVQSELDLGVGWQDPAVSAAHTIETQCIHCTDLGVTHEVKQRWQQGQSCRKIAVLPPSSAPVGRGADGVAAMA